MKNGITVLKAIVLLSILTFLLVPSASSAITNFYKHTFFNYIKIRDVGIVTFENKSPNRKIVLKEVTAQFVSELNKRGWYVIHELKEEDLSSMEALANIDALFKGEILEYSDLEPLRFGVKLSLTDLRTKETVWSVQETFDGKYQGVVKQVKSYYDSLIDKKSPILGHKLYLISMNKFMEFAFNQLIDTLKVVPEKIDSEKTDSENIEKTKDTN